MQMFPNAFSSLKVSTITTLKVILRSSQWKDYIQITTQMYSSLQADHSFGTTVQVP